MQSEVQKLGRPGNAASELGCDLLPHDCGRHLCAFLMGSNKLTILNILFTTNDPHNVDSFLSIFVSKVNFHSILLQTHGVLE